MLSRSKKGTLVVGGVLLTACFLMPPWIRQLQGTVISRERFLWLFQQPDQIGWGIDYKELLLRAIALTVLTLTALLIDFPRVIGLPSRAWVTIKTLVSYDRKRVAKLKPSSQKLGISAFRLAMMLDESLQCKDDGQCQSLLRLAGEVTGQCDELTEQVTRSSNHQNPEVRLLAVKALDNANFDSKMRNQALAERARDNNVSVRRLAVMTIANRGERASEFLKVLVEGLSDSDPVVRMTSAMAVGNFRNLPPLMRQKLLPLLKDSEKGVREFAAIAISKYFSECKEALPVLVKLAENDKEPLAARVNAINALERFDESGDIVVTALIHILEGDEDALHLWAIQALAVMGDSALPAAEALVRIAKSTDNPCSEAARKCLVSLGLLKG